MDAERREPPAGGRPPVLRLGSLTIDPPLVLAPMAGVGDQAFRRIVRRFGGVGLVVTEFALADRLAARDPKALSKLRFGADERPVAVQILGGDPETMARAAAVARELDPDAVDLNLGCPMRKITRRGSGVALMDDPERVARIITGCRRELDVPLTVKCRLAWSERSYDRDGGRDPYLEVGRIAEELGADAITLHPRSGRALYDGAADWEHVGRLVRAVRIPVIGNGDVRSAGQAVAWQARAGCAGVMIGRAAVARPWIFREIAASWESAGPAGVPEPRRDREALLAGLRAIPRGEPPSRAFHKLRTFAGRYAREAEDTAALRRGLGRARDAEEVLELLAEHLLKDAPPKFSRRSE
jgi:nifR3 family TIM-barrel protein